MQNRVHFNICLCIVSNIVIAIFNNIMAYVSHVMAAESDRNHDLTLKTPPSLYITVIGGQTTTTHTRCRPLPLINARNSTPPDLSVGRRATVKVSLCWVGDLKRLFSPRWPTL